MAAQKKRRMVVIVCCCILFIAGLLLKVSTVGAGDEQSNRYKYYTTVYVDQDVTLWDIAEEYITVEYTDIHAYMTEVKQINHLADEQLQYGTTICVPYYSDEFKQEDRKIFNSRKM